MDTFGEWLLVGACVFAVLLVVTLGIAFMAGSNERGNDDHEFTDDEGQHRG